MYIIIGKIDKEKMIILKRIIQIGRHCVDWIKLTTDRDDMRMFVNAFT